MTDNQVVKWLGMICIAAGITRMGMTPSSILWGTDSTQELICGLIACILMSVGTMVTYTVQSKETGVTGFITTLAITIANIVTTAMLWSSFASVKPLVNPDGMLFTITRFTSLIGFAGGTLVFTFLTFRARVFPLWIPGLLVLMLVSMILPVEDNKYFAFFWGLTYVGMGYCIWADKLKRPLSHGDTKSPSM